MEFCRANVSSLADQLPSTHVKDMKTTDFGIVATSPTISKVKRAQTTMERMERKTTKTYGKRTTLDDLSLNHSVYRGSWEDGAIEDAIGFLQEPRKKKRTHRHNSFSREESATEFTESLHGGPAMLSQSVTKSQALQDKVEVCVAAQSDAVRDDANLETDANDRQLSSCRHIDRQGHAEQELDGPVEQAEPSDEPVVVVSVGDELSVEQGGRGVAGEPDMGIDKASSCRIGDEQFSKSEKRKKRETKENTPQEKYDPWADDPTLPQEHYKPRRSRFRGGDDVDGLVESIDFSKRPEAAIKIKKKSKLSRRKTTGGAIVVHVDDEEADRFGEVEEEPFQPSKSRASKTPVPTIEDDEGEADELLKADFPRPKRKRGRPKKQTGDELTSEAATSAIEEQKSSERAGGSSKRKGKKKDKKEPTASEQDLQENRQASDLEAGVEEAGEPTGRGKTAEVELHVEPEPSTPSPQRLTAQSLADKTNTADPTRTAPELQPTDTQTPKEGTKGPTRHSPISSSKVRYRVGLSRTARIEPLLRIVRK